MLLLVMCWLVPRQNFHLIFNYNLFIESEDAYHIERPKPDASSSSNTADRSQNLRQLKQV